MLVCGYHRGQSAWECVCVWTRTHKSGGCRDPIPKSDTSFRGAQGKEIKRELRSSSSEKEPCQAPFAYHQCGTYSTTKRLSLRLAERAHLGYTRLSRERELVGGNLVSTGNLGVGGSKLWREGILLLGLKWGPEGIPRLDCYHETGARISWANGRWEFELEELRHEVRKKLLNDFSITNKEPSPAPELQIRVSEWSWPLTSNRFTDTLWSACLNHLPYL